MRTWWSLGLFSFLYDLQHAHTSTTGYRHGTKNNGQSLKRGGREGLGGRGARESLWWGPGLKGAQALSEKIFSFMLKNYRTPLPAILEAAKTVWKKSINTHYIHLEFSQRI